MEGIILAAGLGTRLRPLTDGRPKALVEVGGQTLIERAIVRLSQAGVRHVVVNVHHLADMLEGYLCSQEWPCAVSISDERELLLDTGGALRHAAPLLREDGDVVVYNVDVLSSFSLPAVAEEHHRLGRLATLCVSRRKSSRLLRFDAEGQLLGRDDENPLPVGVQTMAFSGVAVVQRRMLDMLPEDTHPYSIIDQYIRLASQGERVGCYVHDASQWIDAGRPKTLKQASQWIVS